MLLTTILIIYKQRNDQWKKKTRKELIILFIDAPDPDNPAAAAAIMKHILMTSEDNVNRDAHLHIVLTGRPVDLKTPPKLGTNGNMITRQKWETSNPLHARKVLEDGAMRLEKYLIKCNIDPRDITIYDGGMAPCAPLSDEMHDWDFLFDRKDLITSMKEDNGEILSPEEYSTLVNEISALSDEERVDKVLCDILRSYKLSPLSVLKNELKCCSGVVLFLGGPATALVTLCNDYPELMKQKSVGLYGMFGSLSPGKTTLLSNQFNIECDIEAASQLLIDNHVLLEADKYLVTTETAKNNIVMASADELQEANMPMYFIKLHRLWESTHGNRPQPLFDVLPVIAFLSQYNKCFKWLRKKAALYEWKRKGGGQEVQQILSFIDSDNPNHTLVSDITIQRPLDKQQFLKFMHKTWT